MNASEGGGNRIPGGGSQNSGSKRKSTKYPLPPWMVKKTTKRPFSNGGNGDGSNSIGEQSVGSNSINVGGSSDGNNNNIDGIGGKIPADGEDSVGDESATFPVFQPIEAELETEPPNFWSDSGGRDDSNGDDDDESGSKGESGDSGSSDYETRGGEIDQGSKGDSGGSGSSDSGFGGGSSDPGSKGDRDYGGSGSDSEVIGNDQGSDEGEDQGRGPKFLPSDAETSTDDGRILVEGIPVVQTPTNESSQTLQTPTPTNPTTVSIQIITPCRAFFRQCSHISSDSSLVIRVHC